MKCVVCGEEMNVLASKTGPSGDEPQMACCRYEGCPALRVMVFVGKMDVKRREKVMRKAQ